MTLCSKVPKYRRFENNPLNYSSESFTTQTSALIYLLPNGQTNTQTQCNTTELTDWLPVKMKGIWMKTCDYFRSKPEILLKHELVELVGPVGTKPHPLWSSMTECTWFNVVRIMTQGWYWYLSLYYIYATTGQQSQCRHRSLLHGWNTCRFSRLTTDCEQVCHTQDIRNN